MEEKEIILSKYELMVIIPAEIGEEETGKVLSEIRDEIKSLGHGEIFNEDLWGVRELTFNIKKHAQGFYAVFNFTFDPAKMKELEKHLLLHQLVLRYLLVKIREDYEIKTLAQYEEEFAKEEAERKKQQAEKEKEEMSRRPVQKPRPVEKKAPAKKEEKEPVEKKKVAKPVVEKEEAETELEKPAAKKAKEEDNSKSKLEEMDKKLRSIIEDPDISL